MDMRRRAVAGLVAVLVAAGLAACGDGGGGGGEDAGGRPLLPAAGGGSGGGAADAVASQAQVKTMAPEASGGASAADPALAPVQPVEYRLADDAEAPPKTAPAYRIVPDGDLTAAGVAKALGLSADEADDDALEVQPGLGWFYGPDAADSVASSSSTAVACAPEVTGPAGACDAPPPPEPPAGVPSAAEAEARFRTILKGLGIDAAEGKIVSDDGDNLFARSVRFTPAVDGRPVEGLETTVSFGGEGRIEYGSGFFGRLEKLGDYPLVGLDEAFRRFQDGGGSSGRGGVETMTAEAQPDTAPNATATATAGGGGAAADDGGATMTIEPQPAAPEPVAPRIVEITGADVVLEVVYPDCEDGELVIVPTFRLRTDEGEDQSYLTVPAVEESSMDAPDPDQEPAPCPEDEAQPGEEPAGKPEPEPATIAPDEGSSAGSSGTGPSGSGEPTPIIAPPSKP
jgi:hypothetical protein